MSFTGTVENGIIKLPADAALPNGTKVRIETVSEPLTKNQLTQRLVSIASTARNLPSDLAAEHDHYIHGRHQRQTAEETLGIIVLVASHALAVRFAPNCASYRSILGMAQREAWVKSQPAIAVPVDPILQSQQLLGADQTIIEAETAGLRAEAISRARRGE